MPDIGNLKCNHGKSPLKSYEFWYNNCWDQNPCTLIVVGYDRKSKYGKKE